MPQRTHHLLPGLTASRGSARLRPPGTDAGQHPCRPGAGSRAGAPGSAPGAPGFIWLRPAADTGNGRALPQTPAGNDRVVTKAPAGSPSGPGRTNPVTDNQNTPDVFASLMRPWIVQLRMITEGLAGRHQQAQRACPVPAPALAARPAAARRRFRGAAGLLRRRHCRAANQHRGRRRLSWPCSTSSLRRWSRWPARSPSGARHGHSSKGS